MFRFLFTAMALVSVCFPVKGIIVRHDISETRYLLADLPEFLVDLPHDGHAVLIHPQWLVTVAHTIFYDYRGKEIMVGDQKVKISEVIIHPEYVAEIPPHLLKGHGRKLGKFFLSRSDIALIKLDAEVANLQPIQIYTGSDEQGKKIRIVGKGATGNGKVGENSESKEKRIARYCENQINSADGNWLSYIFDADSSALALEGMHGSGDSGGPSIVIEDGKQFLIGLSSWQLFDGELTKFVGGLYGTKAYQVRISRYADWIRSTIDKHK